MRRSLGFGPAAPAAGPAESLAAHPPNPSSTSRTLGGRRGIVHPDYVAPSPTRWPSPEPTEH